MKNLILILASILFLGSGLFFVLQETKAAPIPALTKKIEQDLNLAQIQNFFPPSTQSLSQIKIITHTKNPVWKELILKSIQLPFSKNLSGQYSLQIDAIENFEPTEEAILILQFNIFDNKTKNKIWESSRIYHLDKDTLKFFPQTTQKLPIKAKTQM